MTLKRTRTDRDDEGRVISRRAVIESSHKGWDNDLEILQYPEGDMYIKTYPSTGVRGRDKWVRVRHADLIEALRYVLDVEADS